MLKSILIVVVLAVAARTVSGASLPSLNAKSSGVTGNFVNDLRQLMQGVGAQYGKLPTLKGLECATCVLVIKELVAELGQNSTQQKIIGGLEKLCTKLPDVDDCTDFFKQYGDQIVSIVLLLMSPAGICGFAGACPNSTINALQAGNSFQHGSPLPVL